MKRIQLVILMVFIAIPIISETFVYDFYTKERREEKIASKIRKCKDVVNVTVRDDNEESTCADAVIELTNNRSIYLKHVDLKLKGYNTKVINIGGIYPIKWGYETGKSSSTSWYFSLSPEVVSFSELKYFMRKNNWNILDLINNYDEIYCYLNKLPDWDSSLPRDYFEIRKDTQAEFVYPIWEEYKNPFFIKGHDDFKRPYGYKFFKTDVKAFTDIWHWHNL
ncbi:MAG: hypothetical protein GX568_03745 [Candidatus Gastranaerophilales bacterium]|nr:hypothetical protein [Candidatus Gastranaerophilales bacterium]